MKTCSGCMLFHNLFFFWIFNVGKVAEIDENLTDLDNDTELLYATYTTFSLFQIFNVSKVAEIDDNLTDLDNDEELFHALLTHPFPLVLDFQRGQGGRD